MSGTRRDTTARWCLPAPALWFMGQVGITRRISVRQCGMAGRIRTVWERASHIALIPDGALASVMDMATIPGITRGGDRWAITAVAGIHTTDGAHGAEPQSRMCTGCGATR